MGTGFKCISTVWRARRRVATPHAAWQPASQPYDRHVPGWLRPRALRVALEQETAEKGADAPSARALAAELVRIFKRLLALMTCIGADISSDDSNVMIWQPSEQTLPIENL